MALDTRGLVDGAVRGFGLVDAYYDKEEDRKRRDTMDQEQRDFRGQQQENWQAGQDESARRYTLEDGYRKSQADQNQKNVDRAYSLQSAQLKNSQENQAWQRARTNKEDARVTAEREKQQDLADIQMAYSDALQGVELSDKSLALMEKYPNYNIAKYLNPEVSQSIDFFEQGAATIKNDDDLISFVNTPQARKAFGAMYADQIGKGDGKNKAVEAFVPIIQEGKKYIAVHLGVDGEDGKRYTAPITHNRTSQPDDNVKLIPVEMIQQQIQEMAGINGALKNMKPAAKSRLTQTMISKGWLAKPDAGEWKSGGDGLLFNDKTGATKNAGGAGGGKPTNNAKKYQELLALGTPDDVAKGVAYGTMKSITDPNSGSVVVIDLTTNQPIGGFQPINPEDPYGPSKWVGSTRSPTPSNNGDEAALIQKLMTTNPGLDEAKARAFLIHKGYIK